MKKLTQLSLILLLFLSAESFAQSSDQVVITAPVSYNDYIVNAQNAIGEKIVNLMTIVNEPTSSYDAAKEGLRILNSTIDESIAKLENLKTLDSDYGLKQSAMNLFQFYRRTIQNQYVQLIDIIYSEDPDVDALNELVNQVTNDEKIYDEDFQATEQKFADANNFTLEKNDLQETIDGGTK